jgi:hypothetical protein
VSDRLQLVYQLQHQVLEQVEQLLQVLPLPLLRSQLLVLL